MSAADTRIWLTLISDTAPRVLTLSLSLEHFSRFQSCSPRSDIFFTTATKGALQESYKLKTGLTFILYYNFIYY